MIKLLSQIGVEKMSYSVSRVRRADQCDGMGSLEINPYFCAQLGFGKGTKTTQWGKNRLLSYDARTTG